MRSWHQEGHRTKQAFYTDYLSGSTRSWLLAYVHPKEFIKCIKDEVTGNAMLHKFACYLLLKIKRLSNCALYSFACKNKIIWNQVPLIISMPGCVIVSKKFFQPGPYDANMS